MISGYALGSGERIQSAGAWHREFKAGSSARGLKKLLSLLGSGSYSGEHTITGR
jgi:hypothetical protein